MPDIFSWGKKTTGKEIDPKDYGLLKQVGMDIRKMCEQHGLHVLMLQPFGNFEGWPKGSEERQEAFERAYGWSSIMEAVGTDMLQVGVPFMLVVSSSQLNRSEVRTHPISRETSTILRETLRSSLILWPRSSSA